MEKSVDAFRTISEVADDLDLPQHVLRFWETRFAQIRPLKRAGGRRYYRPADIVLLRSIRQLLYDEGYTIKGVQRLLKEKGPRVLREDLPNGSEPAAFDAAESADGNPPDDLLEPRLAPDLPMDEPGETSGPVSAGQADETDAPAFDRDALWEALATIEECERILKAVRHPCS